MCNYPHSSDWSNFDGTFLNSKLTNKKAIYSSERFLVDIGQKSVENKVIPNRRAFTNLIDRE